MFRFFFRLSALTVVGGYLGLSYYSNTDYRLERFRPLEVEWYRRYELRQYTDSIRAEIPVSAKNHREAAAIGESELLKYYSEDPEDPVKYLKPLYVTYTPNRKDSFEEPEDSSDRLFPKLNLFTNKDKNEVYTVQHSVKSSQGKYIRKPKNPHVKAIKARGYTCAVRGFRGISNEFSIWRNKRILKKALERQGHEIEYFRVAEYHDRWVFLPFRRIEVIAVLKEKK